MTQPSTRSDKASLQDSVSKQTLFKEVNEMTWQVKALCQKPQVVHHPPHMCLHVHILSNKQINEILSIFKE